MNVCTLLFVIHRKPSPVKVKKVIYGRSLFSPGFTPYLCQKTTYKITYYVYYTYTSGPRSRTGTQKKRILRRHPYLKIVQHYVDLKIIEFLGAAIHTSSSASSRKQPLQPSMLRRCKFEVNPISSLHASFQNSSYASSYASSHFSKTFLCFSGRSIAKYIWRKDQKNIWRKHRKNFGRKHKEEGSE